MSTKFVTLLWNNGGQRPDARTRTSTRTSIRHRTSAPASTRRRPATGSTSLTPRAPRCSGSSRRRSTGEAEGRSRTSCEAIFLDKLPFIPLFIGPRWSTYSTKYFKGFPTWKNQYVDPIFTTRKAGRRRSCCPCIRLLPPKALLGVPGGRQRRPPDTIWSCAAHTLSRLTRSRHDTERRACGALHPPEADVLRGCLLGRDHAQLPAAAPDARARRSTALISATGRRSRATRTSSSS